MNNRGSERPSYPNPPRPGYGSPLATRHKIQLRQLWLMGSQKPLQHSAEEELQDTLSGRQAQVPPEQLPLQYGPPAGGAQEPPFDTQQMPLAQLPLQHSLKVVQDPPFGRHIVVVEVVLVEVLVVLVVVCVWQVPLEQFPLQHWLPFVQFFPLRLQPGGSAAACCAGVR